MAIMARYGGDGGRWAECGVGGGRALLAVLREASPKRGLTFYDGGGGPAVATILPRYIHTFGTHKKIFRPVVF